MEGVRMIYPVPSVVESVHPLFTFSLDLSLAERRRSEYRGCHHRAPARSSMSTKYEPIFVRQIGVNFERLR